MRISSRVSSLKIAFLGAVLALCGLAQDGTLPSGGYTPPASSMMRLMETDPVLRDGILAYARTGDKKVFRESVLQAAEAGDVGAELMLGEEYIPEQCPHEPDRDPPHCETLTAMHETIDRPNPLGIAASYDSAIQWLKEASAHGCGEASEVLAQLITRMQANGHASKLGKNDSVRFHALARSQGFDIERIHVTCYREGQKGSTTTQSPLAIVDNDQFTPAMTRLELTFLEKAGVASPLTRDGGMDGGGSVLLMRPEDAGVQVRVILDHRPTQQVLLPIPAHHDVVFLQQGEQFQAFPSSEPKLGRFVLLQPSPDSAADGSVFLYVQDLTGGYGGGPCATFSPRR